MTQIECDKVTDAAACFPLVRERKQTHVATLEAKVAEYEAEKLTRDVKERDARRGLEELVDKLKAENSALESRVQELEAVIRQMQYSQQQQSAPQYQQLSYPSPGGFYPSMTSRPHPCLQAGCRAPSHEAVPLNERRKRPLPTRTPSSPNKVQHEQDIPDGPSPTGSNFSTSRFGAMSIATALSPPMESSTSTLRSRLPQSQQRLPSLYGEAPASPSLMARESNDIEMDRDCGFCTDSTPCLCCGEAVLDLTGIDEEGDNDESISTSRWMSGVDQMVKIEEEDDSQLMASSDVTRARPTTATVGNESRYSSGSSMPVSSLLARPRSVAKPKLWAMTPATEEAKIEPAPTTVNRATTSYGNKLWWTQPLSSTGTMTKTTSALCTWTPAAAPTADAVAQSSAAGVTTAEEVAAAEALCSGDPSNCPACETDPALAAFCEAVGEGDEDGEEGDGTGDDTSTRPIRRASAASSLESSISATGISAQGVEKQSTSSGRPAMAPRSLTSPTAHKMIPMGIERSSSYTVSNPNEHGGYSAVPDAFRQIRSHPGFPKWQGGLNLLADVVSGRGSPQGTGAEPRTQAISSASASAASSRPFARAKALNFVVDEQQQQERRARHPSVEIVSHTRQTSLVESGDRNVMDDGETEAANSTEGDEKNSGGVQGAPTASTAAKMGPPQNSMSPLGSSHDGIISNHHKRRRLYLKNDRVEEALRLLDNRCGASGSQRGLGAGGARADGMTTVEMPCGECPCPCPWAQQQQQREGSGNARE